MRLIRMLSESRRAPWLVAGLAVLAALLGVFTLPALDRDEARFAQATAQMLETGDFVRIQFLDQPRHKKPIGIHWLQAVSVPLASSEDARAIWAYRLPSVLGAVLAALAAFFAAARLFGREAGLAAGGLFAVSVLLGAEAGIAKTDAMLAGCTALSFWAIAELRLAADTANGRPRLWAVVLAVAVASGALIKGPVTPMAAGLAVLALALWERRIDWLRPLLFWPGPVLAALIVLPWLIAVQIATDGAFLTEALGEDLGPKVVSGHEGHGAPPGAHMLLLPILFFPAIAFLPAGVRAAWVALRAGGSAGLSARIAIAFVLPTWLVFELLPTKLPHYVLPAYPALAALAGLGFVRWVETPALWRWLGGALLVLGALVSATLFAGLARWFDGAMIVAGLTGAGLILAALIGAVIGGRGRACPALVAALAAGLVWHAGGRGIVAPSADSLFPAEQVAERITSLVRRLPPDAALVSTYTEPSLAFRLGGHVRLTTAAALAADPLAFDSPTLYVFDMSRWTEAASEDQAAEIAFFEGLHAEACEVQTFDAFNYSRGDPVTILIAAVGCVPEPGDTR